MQDLGAQPDQRVSSAKGVTSTTGSSTKLVRMKKKIGRKEELLCAALSTINPQPNTDGE